MHRFESVIVYTKREFVTSPIHCIIVLYNQDNSPCDKVSYNSWKRLSLAWWAAWDTCCDDPGVVYKWKARSNHIKCIKSRPPICKSIDQSTVYCSLFVTGPLLYTLRSSKDCWRAFAAVVDRKSSVRKCHHGDIIASLLSPLFIPASSWKLLRNRLLDRYVTYIMSLLIVKARESLQHDVLSFLYTLTAYYR